MPWPLNFSGRVWELLSEEGRREALEEFGRAFQAQIDGKIEWTGDLARLANLLTQDEATKSDLATFWVRLHGVLELVMDARDSCGPFVPVNDLQVRVQEVARDVADKGRALLRCLRDEDLLLIEYERHRASHPFLDSYFWKFKGDTPTLRKDRRCTLLSRTVSLTEIRNVLRSFEAHGSSEEVARSLASRVKDAAHAYHAALTARHDIFGIARA